MLLNEIRFFQCSKSCGRGERQREIYCVFNNQNVVDNSFCSGEKSPVSKEVCNVDACPAWTVGEWSTCSCKTGRRNRTVTCIFTGVQTSTAACQSLAKPAEHEDCSHSNCPVWKVGLWNSCSATCGTGFKTRDVYCAVESRFYIFYLLQNIDYYLGLIYSMIINVYSNFGTTTGAKNSLKHEVLRRKHIFNFAP